MRIRFILYSILSLIIGASLLAVSAVNYRLEHQDTQSYIVQAYDLEQAKSAVRTVGGEITHQLGIINAVGARLNQEQVQSLRGMEDVRRVSEDRGVSTSGDGKELIKSENGAQPHCELSAESELKFGDDDITWQVANASDAHMFIKQIMVIWPGSNYRLEQIDFGGSRIFTGRRYGISATLTVRDGYENDARLRIESGAKNDLRVDFQSIRKEQDPYELRLFFQNGCSIDFPIPPGKKFSGDSDLEAKRTYISSLVGADALHWKGITGDGVGVAVIDTGIWTDKGRSNYLANDSDGKARIAAHYDAISNRELKTTFNSDKNGHGSHVSSLLASSRYKDSEFNGIAPDADLIAVQAFNSDGQGTYTDVIRALDWVVKTKEKYGTRVLNLSFSTDPSSYYWDDPLNQAVMAAWRAGLVVVASAGNKGPDPMTIGVPGNVPYVITVGAMTDNVTMTDWTDDTLASFSAAGPTVEAFVKPEIVAPGGHVRGMMESGNKIAKKHPHFHDGDSYYTMSGTSQATAVASGIVALLLQVEPWLTPDQVKCKLIASARPAVDGKGNPAYSVFQQGAGLVDAEAALSGRDYKCANNNLDIEADLAGKAHFRGPANRDSTGSYYIEGVEGHVWDGGYSFSDGYLWGVGMIWNDGMIWNNGMIWNDGMIQNNGMIWNDGVIWNNGMIWNDGHILPVSINVWVEQE